MIHYHGTPITPRPILEQLAGRHFCVSYAAPRDVEVCHRIGQSVMLDNGAYSFWNNPLAPPVDWEAWAEWARPWLDHPTTWAVLPDVIDGDEFENDHLASVYAWMVAPGAVAPVWHLHESLGRLEKLCASYGRVCFGSSGQYREVGSQAWRRRVHDAFNRIASPAGRVPWVHMLRGMSLAGDEFPFASVDSTNIAQNHAPFPSRAKPRYDVRQMADRLDAVQCPGLWKPVDQLTLEEGAA